MRMGIVSERRKRERTRRIRRRLWIAAAAALLSVAAMSPGLRGRLTALAGRGVQAAQAFAAGRSEQAMLTLPQREVYALQLGVFDSGERASDEAQRLQALDVRCIVWQREKMRIVSAVALSRDALDLLSAKGQDAYVIRETLPEVSMRLSAGEGELDGVRAMLSLPDALLTDLLSPDGTELTALLEDTRRAAQAAIAAHPENALYTQLAQSLVNWCALIGQTADEPGASCDRTYAAVTMCTLCRELRLAVQRQ